MGSQRPHPPGPDVGDIGVATYGRWVIVTITGELDLGAAPRLRDALDPEALPGGRAHLAVDLSGVTFCDSACVGVLVGAYEKLRGRGGQLVLLHTPALLTRQLRISGLDRVLALRESVDPGQGPA